MSLKKVAMYLINCTFFVHNILNRVREIIVLQTKISTSRRLEQEQLGRLSRDFRELKLKCTDAKDLKRLCTGFIYSGEKF
jgi:hypothetical protein